MKKHSCYFDKCGYKITHVWFPAKNPGPLYLCNEHFDQLSQVYETVEVKLPKDIVKIVRVVR